MGAAPIKNVKTKTRLHLERAEWAPLAKAACNCAPAPRKIQALIHASGATRQKLVRRPISNPRVTPARIDLTGWAAVWYSDCVMVVRNGYKKSITQARRIVVALLLVAAGWSQAAWQPLPAARNAIILIPDGCSHATVTLARWYAGRPLAVDVILTGAVRTHTAAGVVTDSAAAATALATGHKTLSGALALAPPPDAPFRTHDAPTAAWHPVATLLEAARHQGRATGLVVTGSPSDATPAGFAAHAVSRKASDAILMQIAHQNFDIVLGGGRSALTPVSDGGSRRDNIDLRAELIARRYQVVTTGKQLMAASSSPVWGAFADTHLAPQADSAETNPGQPSLAALTKKAIELLQHNPNGFVLVVEGNLIDWCAHANDAFGAVTEFLAFDDAVRVALAFAAQDGQTLVVACPDNETSGLAIGSRIQPYQDTPDTWVAPLRQMRLTAMGIEHKLGPDTSRANLAAHVRAWWGITLTPAQADELDSLVNTQGYRPSFALGDVVSRHYLQLTWTSFEHTGEDVPLWSYGPGRPLGNVDNTEVARAVAAALRLDLVAATRDLFVDADTLETTSAVVTHAPGGPALRLGCASVPVNRDVLILSTRQYRLGGVVVHIAETGKTYLPRLPPALLTQVIAPAAGE